ncbi:MAG: 1-acyl-sn-glycerol-3-phosphate acyltransferase [Clostridia bacterium]|nr:1-acyl-sn-glycerol-3-phosphate acyltransferase [Clostridia bacterium]
MNNFVYNFVWFLCKPAFAIAFPHRVYGRENLPKEGGFILCANHMNAIDPLYICSQIPLRRKIHFLAKKELFAKKFTKWFFTHLHAIPVDRGAADLSAIRSALKSLKEGYGVGIFPQGTRSKTNERMPMLSGVSMIAMRSDCPIIPCFIDGPYGPFKRVNVYFGKPIDREPFGKRSDRAALEEMTRAIEDAVWNLKK